MTDYKTLRVPEHAWEEAKEQKEEHGRTWGEQLVCDGESESGIDAEQILNRIDDLENTLPRKIRKGLR